MSTRTIKHQRIFRAPTGHRAGESHPRARMTDEDVELARQLHEAGVGYGEISKKLDTYHPPLARSTIADVCQYRHRRQP